MKREKEKPDTLGREVRYEEYEGSSWNAWKGTEELIKRFRHRSKQLKDLKSEEELKRFIPTKVIFLSVRIVMNVLEFSVNLLPLGCQRKQKR